MSVSRFRSRTRKTIHRQFRVRYLTYFSQALMPLRPGEVFYTFQGISTDGQHYLAVTLPVLAGLPGATPVADYDRFVQDYPAYLQQLIDRLNTMPASAFTPGLDALDTLVASVTVR